MKMIEYQKLALRTAPQTDRNAGFSPTELRNNDILHGVLGIQSEAGELADALKKAWFNGRELDLTNIKEEIGDVLWYLALACRGLGTTLEDVAHANVAKLRNRYPDKYADECSAGRDIEAERAILEGGKA